jgi:hypothetical protein
VYSLKEFYSWTPYERVENQICFCGEYGSFGVPVNNGFSIQFYCFKHWKESKWHTQLKEKVQKEQKERKHPKATTTCQMELL